MQRIAVWNTAFLGDAVLTLPLLQSLRLRYPNARLDFYVRGGLDALFRPHPALTAVYAYDKRRGKGLTKTIQMAKDLAKRRYDLWISAHTSPRSAALALAARAPVRIGYKGSLTGHLAYTSMVNRGFFEREEIERLLALLDPLGGGPVEYWPKIVLEPVAKEEAKRFFSLLQGPTLGLHPGSIWPSKRWPAVFFAEIGLRALREGMHVLLFAGRGEESIAQEVRQRIHGVLQKEAQERLYDLSGALSLPLLAAYLGHLSCYVTNDSGPMHLAWAQHTPVTAIFGPTVRALGFFPRGEGSRVFENELSCRPCGLHGHTSCPQGHHHCMLTVSPEAVWEDVRTKLQRG